MEKTDVNIRRRIELIQDFGDAGSEQLHPRLPGRAVHPGERAYKPRVRCYDTQEMSMKFERFVEFHAQYGKYYRVRIPKFGRDLAYQTELCHLYVVGASNEVYRMNLEEGKFMPSLASTLKTELNSIDINPVHQLVITGTADGHVEAWDPRSGKSEGIINCALPELIQDDPSHAPFGVTKVKFKDGLNLAVGTSTGQVLLYDIRSPKPYYIKDHNYGLPIRSIDFLPDQDYIASMDTKILKIWERESGKAVTSVEPGSDLNDLCIVPHTGLMFMATEAPKMLSYFIPSLGPAPKWCAFLDNMTEELEESAETAIYDDYKFLTADELDALGLSDLIGTSLLRAYMHGFFVDVRLYRKAKSIVEPFNYQEYRKQKITEKLVAEQTESRVQTIKLPKVNAALARKFLDPTVLQDEKSKRKAKLVSTNPLEDDRFKALFSNPAFEVDTTTDEYRLLNPLVSKMDRRRETVAAENVAEQDTGEEPLDDEVEDVDAALASVRAEAEGRRQRTRDDSAESSDDDREWVTERRKQHRLIEGEKAQAAARRRPKPAAPSGRGRVMEVETDSGRYRGMNKPLSKANSRTLESRLAAEESRHGAAESVQLPGGNRQMTFSMGGGSGKRFERSREESAQHLAERRKLHRSGRPIESRMKKPWKGKK
ncbi:Nucleolar protein 10 [Hypsibius exemplaris]|uniref:Nucleolar protein 10 n=1 Tax=Hypsibius exemplaris TaxID=2072580 RepID=A0A1W0W9G8_HYPEX|nr:Nucleolar protein 10 [Hypsibius exemplaris]